MNQLYLLCKPHLVSYQQYVDRLDSLPSASSDIQTLEEAKQYWVKHFANKTLKLVVTSGKDKKGMPKKYLLKSFLTKTIIMRLPMMSIKQPL